MAWGRRITVAVAAAAAAAGMTSTPAGGDVVDQREIVEAVAEQVPGAEVTSSSPEEPIVGVPGPADLAVGRAETMSDPAFWTQVVGNALVDQTVVLPKPVDVVKPEMYLPTVPVPHGGFPVYKLREN